MTVGGTSKISGGKTVGNGATMKPSRSAPNSRQVGGTGQ
jgi:hypothetical protein